MVNMQPKDNKIAVNVVSPNHFLTPVELYEYKLPPVPFLFVTDACCSSFVEVYVVCFAKLRNSYDKSHPRHPKYYLAHWAACLLRCWVSAGYWTLFDLSWIFRYFYGLSNLFDCRQVHVGFPFFRDSGLSLEPTQLLIQWMFPWG